jgi:hypothetical protein
MPRELVRHLVVELVPAQALAPRAGRRRSEALPASGWSGGVQRLGARLAHLHRSG